jgi:hypothetical protein
MGELGVEALVDAVVVTNRLRTQFTIDGSRVCDYGSFAVVSATVPVRGTRLFHGAFETQLHYRVEFWIYFFDASDVLSNNGLT